MSQTKCKPTYVEEIDLNKFHLTLAARQTVEKQDSIKLQS